ncbi:Mitogen-activated protein kinase kinase kinase NPK1 [Diplonema papillatum]|nr:Mitogen-activated protein kinase kinase kinase NPK1 [Diplonema papillatum]
MRGAPRILTVFGATLLPLALGECPWDAGVGGVAPAAWGDRFDESVPGLASCLDSFGGTVLVTASDVAGRVFDEIFIGAQCTVALADEEMLIVVRTLNVAGRLHVGSAECPTRQNITFSLLPLGEVSIMKDGFAEFYGAPFPSGKKGFTSLSAPAAPGDSSIVVDDASDFPVGTRVLIAASLNASDFDEATVTAASGGDGRLHLDTPLDHHHCGAELLGWGAARVFALNRTLSIAGSANGTAREAPFIRSHGDSTLTLSGVSLKYLGRPGQFTSNPVTFFPGTLGLVTQSVIYKSAHHCVEVLSVPKRPAKVTLSGNVAFDVAGVCFMVLSGVVPDLVVLEDLYALNVRPIEGEGEEEPRYPMDTSGAGFYLEELVVLRGELMVVGARRGFHFTTNAMVRPPSTLNPVAFHQASASAHLISEAGLYVGGLGNNTAGPHSGPRHIGGPFDYVEHAVFPALPSRLRPIVAANLRLRACGAGVQTREVSVHVRDSVFASCRIAFDARGSSDLRNSSILGSPELRVYRAPVPDNPAAAASILRAVETRFPSVRQHGVTLPGLLDFTQLVDVSFDDFHALSRAQCPACYSPGPGEEEEEETGPRAVQNAAIAPRPAAAAAGGAGVLLLVDSGFAPSGRGNAAKNSHFATFRHESAAPGVNRDFASVVAVGGNGSGSPGEMVLHVPNVPWWSPCAACAVESDAQRAQACEGVTPALVHFRAGGLTTCGATCHVGTLQLFGRETDEDIDPAAGAASTPFTWDPVWSGPGNMGWRAIFNRGAPTQFEVSPVRVEDPVTLAIGYPKGTTFAVRNRLAPELFAKVANLSTLSADPLCAGFACYYVSGDGTLHLKVGVPPSEQEKTADGVLAADYDSPYTITVDVLCAGKPATVEEVGFVAYETCGLSEAAWTTDLDTKCDDTYTPDEEPVDGYTGQVHWWCDPDLPANRAFLSPCGENASSPEDGESPPSACPSNVTSAAACAGLCGGGGGGGGGSGGGGGGGDCRSFNYHTVAGACRLFASESCPSPVFSPFSPWVYYAVDVPPAPLPPGPGGGLGTAGFIGVFAASAFVAIAAILAVVCLRRAAVGGRPPTPLSEESNTCLGKLQSSGWRLEKVIGRGAFGVVYKGYLSSGEVVAIKVVAVGCPDWSAHNATDPSSKQVLSVDSPARTATNTNTNTNTFEMRAVSSTEDSAASLQSPRFLEAAAGASPPPPAASLESRNPTSSCSSNPGNPIIQVRDHTVQPGQISISVPSEAPRGRGSPSAFSAELQEVDRLRTLQHPNIVKYLSAEIVDDHLCIVMELAANGSIAALVRRSHGSLPVNRVRRYTLQMVKGLRFLHKNRIMHRDIKGENLLLGDDDVLKVSDFGCSKFIAELQMTAANTVVGTPRWMAPEVITSPEHGYGLKADIWSAGCTVCEMLTGQPPWPEFSTAWSTMYHIVHSDPQLPSISSPAALAFIEKTLQKVCPGFFT